MIELPVVKSSGTRTRSNSDVLQSISSSASLLRLVIRLEKHAIDSMTKSRVDTASSECSSTESNPRSFAVRSRSIGKPVDANAAAPRGLTFVRSYAVMSRAKSRVNASACANA